MRSILYAILPLLTLSVRLYSQNLNKVSFYVDLNKIDYRGKFRIRGNSSTDSRYKTTRLEKISKDYYGITLSFENQEPNLEYKFVISQGRDNIRWEDIENRSKKIIDRLKLDEKWNVTKPIIIEDLLRIPLDGIHKYIKALSEVITTIYTSLLRYNDIEDFKSFFFEIKESITEDVTYGQAFLLPSKITNKVKVVFITSEKRTKVLNQRNLNRPKTVNSDYLYKVPMKISA